MMKRLIWGMAALLGLCGCETEQANQVAVVDSETIWIDVQSPSAHAVELPRGTALRVVLEANQTTPYKWRVTELPSGMRVVDDDYAGHRYGGPNDPQPVGAGGTQSYRFLAERMGRRRLVLQHVGSLGDVVQTVSIDVTIT